MVTFDYKKTPITQIADYIIMYSAKSGASDIHFDPRENGLMVGSELTVTYKTIL